MRRIIQRIDRRAWRRSAMVVSALLSTSCFPASWAELQLKAARLGCPTPSFPYYHFRADLRLPQPSMLEVEASIDGQKLRYVALKDAAKPIDTSRPLIRYRPPFADVYAVNTIVYQQPYIIGWLAWQLGRNYRLDVKVRLKKDVENTPDDVILQGSADLGADGDGPGGVSGGRAGPLQPGLSDLSQQPRRESPEVPHGAGAEWSRARSGGRGRPCGG